MSTNKTAARPKARQFLDVPKPGDVAEGRRTAQKVGPSGPRVRGGPGAPGSSRADRVHPDQAAPPRLQLGPAASEVLPKEQTPEAECQSSEAALIKAFAAVPMPSADWRTHVTKLAELAELYDRHVEKFGVSVDLITAKSNSLMPKLKQLIEGEVLPQLLADAQELPRVHIALNRLGFDGVSDLIDLHRKQLSQGSSHSSAAGSDHAPPEPEAQAKPMQAQPQPDVAINVVEPELVLPPPPQSAEPDAPASPNSEPQPQRQPLLAPARPQARPVPTFRQKVARRAGRVLNALTPHRFRANQKQGEALMQTHEATGPLLELLMRGGIDERRREGQILSDLPRIMKPLTSQRDADDVFRSVIRDDLDHMQEGALMALWANTNSAELQTSPFLRAIHEEVTRKLDRLLTPVHKELERKLRDASGANGVQEDYDAAMEVASRLPGATQTEDAWLGEVVNALSRMRASDSMTDDEIKELFLKMPIADLLAIAVRDHQAPADAVIGLARDAAVEMRQLAFLAYVANANAMADEHRKAPPNPSAIAQAVIAMAGYRKNIDVITHGGIPDLPPLEDEGYFVEVDAATGNIFQAPDFRFDKLQEDQLQPLKAALEYLKIDGVNPVQRALENTLTSAIQKSVQNEPGLQAEYEAMVRLASRLPGAKQAKDAWLGEVVHALSRMLIGKHITRDQMFALFTRMSVPELVAIASLVQTPDPELAVIGVARHALNVLREEAFRAFEGADEAMHRATKVSDQVDTAIAANASRDTYLEYSNVLGLQVDPALLGNMQKFEQNLGILVARPGFPFHELRDDQLEALRTALQSLGIAEGQERIGQELGKRAAAAAYSAHLGGAVAALRIGNMAAALNLLKQASEQTEALINAPGELVNASGQRIAPYALIAGQLNEMPRQERLQFIEAMNGLVLRKLSAALILTGDIHAEHRKAMANVAAELGALRDVIDESFKDEIEGPVPALVPVQMLKPGELVRVDVAIALSAAFGIQVNAPQSDAARAEPGLRATSSVRAGKEARAEAAKGGPSKLREFEVGAHLRVLSQPFATESSVRRNLATMYLAMHDGVPAPTFSFRNGWRDDEKIENEFKSHVSIVIQQFDDDQLFSLWDNLEQALNLDEKLPNYHHYHVLLSVVGDRVRELAPELRVPHYAKLLQRASELLAGPPHKTQTREMVVHTLGHLLNEEDITLEQVEAVFKSVPSHKLLAITRDPAPKEYVPGRREVVTCAMQVLADRDAPVAQKYIELVARLELQSRDAGDGVLTEPLTFAEWVISAANQLEIMKARKAAGVPTTPAVAEHVKQATEALQEFLPSLLHGVPIGKLVEAKLVKPLAEALNRLGVDARPLTKAVKAHRNADVPPPPDDDEVPPPPPFPANASPLGQAVAQLAQNIATQRKDHPMWQEWQERHPKDMTELRPSTDPLHRAVERFDKAAKVFVDAVAAWRDPVAIFQIVQSAQYLNNFRKLQKRDEWRPAALQAQQATPRPPIMEIVDQVENLVDNTLKAITPALQLLLDSPEFEVSALGPEKLAEFETAIKGFDVVLVDKGQPTGIAQKIAAAKRAHAAEFDDLRARLNALEQLDAENQREPEEPPQPARQAQSVSPLPGSPVTPAKPSAARRAFDSLSPAVRKQRAKEAAKKKLDAHVNDILEQLSSDAQPLPVGARISAVMQALEKDVRPLLKKGKNLETTPDVFARSVNEWLAAHKGDTEQLERISGMLALVPDGTAGMSSAWHYELIAHELARVNLHDDVRSFVGAGAIAKQGLASTIYKRLLGKQKDGAGGVVRVLARALTDNRIRPQELADAIENLEREELLELEQAARASGNAQVMNIARENLASRGEPVVDLLPEPEGFEPRGSRRSSSGIPSAETVRRSALATRKIAATSAKVNQAAGLLAGLAAQGSGQVGPQGRKKLFEEYANVVHGLNDQTAQRHEPLDLLLEACGHALTQRKFVFDTGEQIPFTPTDFDKLLNFLPDDVLREAASDSRAGERDKLLWAVAYKTSIGKDFEAMVTSLAGRRRNATPDADVDTIIAAAGLLRKFRAVNQVEGLAQFEIVGRVSAATNKFADNVTELIRDGKLPLAKLSDAQRLSLRAALDGLDLDAISQSVNRAIITAGSIKETIHRLSEPDLSAALAALAALGNFPPMEGAARVRQVTAALTPESAKKILMANGPVAHAAGLEFVARSLADAGYGPLSSEISARAIDLKAIREAAERVASDRPSAAIRAEAQQHAAVLVSDRLLDSHGITISQQGVVRVTRGVAPTQVQTAAVQTMQKVHAEVRKQPQAERVSAQRPQELLLSEARVKWNPKELPAGVLRAVLALANEDNAGKLLRDASTVMLADGTTGRLVSDARPDYTLRADNEGRFFLDCALKVSNADRMASERGIITLGEGSSEVRMTVPIAASGQMGLPDPVTKKYTITLWKPAFPKEELETVLGMDASSPIRAAFQTHVRGKFRAESLNFHDAFQAYKKGPNRNIVGQARALVTEFIGANANQQVNISAVLAEKIVKASDDELMSLLESANTEVVTLIRTNDWKDFIAHNSAAG